MGIYYVNDSRRSINFMYTCKLFSLTLSPQGIGSGYPIGAFVGICVGITLFYTVVLLVLICALILWNKRHR